MNEEVTLKSGRKLSLGMAPFAAARKLLKCVLIEVRTITLNVDVKALLANPDLQNLDAGALTAFKDLLCQIIASDAVEAAFFECAIRSTLNGQKITRETFEEAREDFLPVAWEVMRHNLAPFWSGLDLSSLTKKSPSIAAQG